MSTVTGTVLASWGGLAVTAVTGASTRTATAEASWGGLAVVAAVGDDVSVGVYDPSGSTFRASVVTASGSYRDVLSGGGLGIANITLPLDDPSVASITDRSIVKVGWRGDVRGFRLLLENCALAVDGQQTVTLANMADLLSMLNDGIVWPAGTPGVVGHGAVETRVFGVPSPRGPWYQPADWVRPLGVRMSADPTPRREPWTRSLTIRKSDPYFIAPPPGPSADQPSGVKVWYRREFTTTVAQTVEILMNADDFGTVWLDGVEVITPNYTDAQSWLREFSVILLLPAGEHVIAVRVENEQLPAQWFNSLGMAMVVYLVNGNGDRHGTLIETDLTHWWSSSADVGWFPAQVAWQAVTESQAAGDRGPSDLTLGFTPWHDSNGVLHSVGRTAVWTFDVGKPLDDLIVELSVSGASFDVDARTMTLQYFNRQGTDISGSTALTLGSGSTGNLDTYDTARQSTRFTVAIGKVGDGFWYTRVDSAGVAAIGKVVKVVDLGNSASPEAGIQLLDQLLAQSAKPLVSATAAVNPADAVQINRGIRKGDSITTPGHRAVGTLKQRVWAVTVDFTGDTTVATPELVADPT